MPTFCKGKRRGVESEKNMKAKECQESLNRVEDQGRKEKRTESDERRSERKNE